MDETQPSVGWGATLKGLGRTVASVASNRAELFLVELQEERDFLLVAVCLGMIALLFGVLAAVSLSLVVLVLMWDSHPILALVLLAGLYAGVSVVALRALMKRMRGRESFSASLAEFKKDKEWLHPRN